MFAWFYQQWITTPAPIREPIRSAFVSLSLTFGTVVGSDFGAAVQAGAVDTPQNCLNFMATHFWGQIVGLLTGGAFAAWYRSTQAKTRVANTISLSDGTTAVISKAGS